MPDPAPLRRPRRSPVWRFGACLVFVLAGALFVTSALAARGTDLRAGRRTDLADLVVDREQRVRSLEAQVQTLRAQVDALTKGASTSFSGDLDAALDEIDADAPSAGLTAVTGTALTVTLDDASDVPAPGALPDGLVLDDYVVHQQDIEGVVNALWQGGATAMMIMDQRVIATSAVRCVGTVLSLQGRTYSPPYTIAAIGDPSSLRTALQDSPTVAIYRSYADELGLRYEVDQVSDAMFPAYDGALSLQHAQATTTED